MKARKSRQHERTALHKFNLDRLPGHDRRPSPPHGLGPRRERGRQRRTRPCRTRGIVGTAPLRRGEAHAKLTLELTATGFGWEAVLYMMSHHHDGSIAADRDGPWPAF